MSDRPATGPSEGAAAQPAALRTIWQIQEDLRRRRSRGERAVVEDYLTDELAEILGKSDNLLDLLYGEVMIREDLDESPGLDEYLGRFPQFAREIRDLFAVHKALDGGEWT